MPTPPLSVQLYTVREALEADLDGTIDRLASIGFSRVEPYNFAANTAALSAALERNGMAAPSGHAPLLDGDRDLIFEAARTLGIGTVIEPMVHPERWTTEEAVEQTAQALNEVAALGAEYGITVGYHNHWWEVETDFGGRTGLEVLAGALDPAVVLEVDTYWVAVGGQDPAELLAKLGDRVRFIHLKDGALDKDNTSQVAVGAGRMDVPSVLAAAGSVEVGVVELDDSAGDLFEALEASLHYLQADSRQAGA
ncbi:sugar phosphate isomerase/epimerase [Arthrobacter sp. EH-1B-1]|uniref:Sugar phosphate isomerase/epimerase n=1 Tax=Arthrobacter vasquezii TaxID=2977629 RepID=A0ABT6CX23_9MICC|nr:sugar phosphate isomerase/epimerase [Arthrobacter vasquezii]MDF9278620.1 sugar phosphate isomerase/epimerase [Arthrobacter vasquezii]